MDDGAWKRVAETIRTRREDELDLTQEQLAAIAGVGTATVRKLETAAQDRYNRSTLRSVARALGWTPDGIDRVLRGDEPELETDEDTPSAMAEIAKLRSEVDELSERVDRLQQQDQRS